MIRDEPSVLEAAEKEFRGILNYFTSRSHQLTTHIIPSYSKGYPFSELPATARLDDLSKLLNLDTKNLNLEQLGLDAIKEQHRINLQFSSDKCAIIPEDRAQVMLATVSICLHHVRMRIPLNNHSIHIRMRINHIFIPFTGSTTSAVLRITQNSSPEVAKGCSQIDQRNYHRNGHYQLMAASRGFLLSG